MFFFFLSDYQNDKQHFAFPLDAVFPSSGAKNRGRSRLQSCYLGCDFVRQHADLRSGGTKGIPPGGRTRPAASAASEEEFIHLSAESRRGLRRINRLIGCGGRSPTSICGIFSGCNGSLDFQNNPRLETRAAFEIRNQSEAAAAYPALRDAAENVARATCFVKDQFGCTWSRPAPAAPK